MTYFRAISVHVGVIREFVRYFRDRLRCDLTEMEPLKVSKRILVCFMSRQTVSKMN